MEPIPEDAMFAVEWLVGTVTERDGVCQSRCSIRTQFNVGPDDQIQHIDIPAHDSNAAAAYSDGVRVNLHRCRMETHSHWRLSSAGRESYPSAARKSALA